MPQSRRRKFTWRSPTGAPPRISVFQPPRDVFLRLLDRHAVEEARIDHQPVVDERRVGDDERFRIDARRAHHRHVAEPVLVDEVEVALVVRRAAEDRAGAVFHQDEIRDVDRQRPVGSNGWIALMPVSKPSFSCVSMIACAVPWRLHSAMNVRELRILRGRGLRQRMIRRDRHELRAEQRVVPRGEDLQLALAVRRGLRIEREADQQAFAAADPVALHQPHLVGPAVERIERVEQFLRVLRDLEDPLVHLALLDHGAAIASRARRSPARWRARSCRPGPSSPCASRARRGPTFRKSRNSFC